MRNASFYLTNKSGPDGAYLILLPVSELDRDTRNDDLSAAGWRYAEFGNTGFRVLVRTGLYVLVLHMLFAITPEFKTILELLKLFFWLQQAYLSECGPCIMRTSSQRDRCERVPGPDRRHVPRSKMGNARTVYLHRRCRRGRGRTC